MSDQSRAPERFAAFLERIGAADSDILQHPLIESKQSAALAVNHIATAQPAERATEPGTKGGITVDETIQKAACPLDGAIVRGQHRHGDISKLNRADEKAGGGPGRLTGWNKASPAAVEQQNKRLMYRFGRWIVADLLP
jgi:hypothetical protein